MNAVYIKEFGGAENLEIREVADPPKPTRNDVLVRVKAAGLNRADLLQRRGHYPPPTGYSPNIPGLEFAGEVAEIGEDVQDFKSGNRVFGITAGEAQAELLKIDSRLLTIIPDNLSFTDAAAVPEAFITAHDAVFTQGRLRGAEALMVHAVGSGVGLAALQLGKANGHRVLGTSRSVDKLDRCREFGLDEGITAAGEPNFSEVVLSKTGGRGVDVILDLVGGAYFEQNLKSLALKGRLLLVGMTAGSTSNFNLGIALMKRLTLIGTTLRARSIEDKTAATSAFAAEVVPLLVSGRVRPNVDRLFDFSDVRSAHEYLESNESFGKVILEF
ncbi:MAG: NAD(P)H-quinone oxidoreductase [Acidobacteriota bacterium]